MSYTHTYWTVPIICRTTTQLYWLYRWNYNKTGNFQLIFKVHGWYYRNCNTGQCIYLSRDWIQWERNNFCGTLPPFTQWECKQRETYTHSSLLTFTFRVLWFGESILSLRYGSSLSLLALCPVNFGHRLCGLQFGRRAKMESCLSRRTSLWVFLLCIYDCCVYCLL